MRYALYSGMNSITFKRYESEYIGVYKTLRGAQLQADELDHDWAVIADMEKQEIACSRGLNADRTMRARDANEWDTDFRGFEKIS